MDFSKLFHQSAQPMWLFDPESLRFLEVNEAAVIKYGYSRQDFSVMTVADIRPYEDLPFFSSVFAQVKGDHCFNQSFRHKQRDGSLLNVQITRYGIIKDEQPVYLTIPTLITAEEAFVQHLQQMVGKLEFAILQRITHDRKRFAEIWSLATELASENSSTRQIVLASRIRDIAADMPGKGLN